MDLIFAKTGAMSAHASRIYLAWSNSFTRTLAALGLDAAKPPPPPLADVLAAARPRRDARAAAPDSDVVPAAAQPRAPPSAVLIPIRRPIPVTVPDDRDR